MNSTKSTTLADTKNVSSLKKIHGGDDVEHIMDRYQYSKSTKKRIRDENLLPASLLSRLHNNYPQHSGIMEAAEFIFFRERKVCGT